MSLREGGRYEEEALVDAIAAIVIEAGARTADVLWVSTGADAAKDDAAQLLRAAVYLDQDQPAREAQAAFSALLAAVEARIDAVWPAATPQPQPPARPAPTSGSDSSDAEAEAVVPRAPRPALRSTAWRLEYLDG